MHSSFCCIELNVSRLELRCVCVSTVQALVLEGRLGTCVCRSTGNFPGTVTEAFANDELGSVACVY